MVVRPDVRLPFASAGPSLGEAPADGIDQAGFAPTMVDARIDVDADGQAAAQAGPGAAQARPGVSAVATGSALDDDPHVRAILPRVTSPVTTYGVSEEAMLRAENIRAEAGRMLFDAVWENGESKRLPITLNIPGHHNVLNALAAIAVAMEVGASDVAIQRALAEFAGVGRRFQRYGEIALSSGGSFTLVDDYGHHPVEMAATLAAAREAFKVVAAG